MPMEPPPTRLGRLLAERGIERTFFCGLALDVCVGWSAVDSARLGFDTFVMEELTRSTELPDLLSQVSRAFAEHGRASVRSCITAAYTLLDFAELAQAFAYLEVFEAAYGMSPTGPHRGIGIIQTEGVETCWRTTNIFLT